MSSLVLGRIHELMRGGAAKGRAWGNATTAWAVAQAIAAYGYSYLFDRTDNYALLFGIAVAAIMLALGLELAAGRTGTPPGAPPPPPGSPRRVRVFRKDAPLPRRRSQPSPLPPPRHHHTPSCPH